MVEKNKTRILLIVPMLHQGGFERICTLTAKLLNEVCEVHLLIFTQEEQFYDVTGLHVINLNLGARDGKINKIINLVRRIQAVKKVKKDLNIQVSYSFGTSANLVNVYARAKDIVWTGIRGYGALEEHLALFCRKSDRVICCTKTMEQDITDRCKTKTIATLYNPCDQAEILRMSKEAVPEEIAPFVHASGKLIVSMGREDDLKGFWHLIKSFYLLNQQDADCRLMIIGEGAYKEYKELAAALHIQDKVLFTGVQKNPFCILKQADLYALTSESEGFPNALIEAMVLGVPCVSVNCKTGPAEILGDNPEQYKNQHETVQAAYGILTPVFQGEKNLNPQIFTEEETIFAEQMRGMLENDSMRLSYIEKAKQKAAQFGLDVYVEHLMALVTQDVKERNDKQDEW